MNKPITQLLLLLFIPYQLRFDDVNVLEQLCSFQLVEKGLKNITDNRKNIQKVNIYSAKEALYVIQQNKEILKTFGNHSLFTKFIACEIVDDVYILYFNQQQIEDKKLQFFSSLDPFTRFLTFKNLLEQFIMLKNSGYQIASDENLEIVKNFSEYFLINTQKKLLKYVSDEDYKEDEFLIREQDSCLHLLSLMNMFEMYSQQELMKQLLEIQNQGKKMNSITSRDELVIKSQLKNQIPIEQPKVEEIEKIKDIYLGIKTERPKWYLRIWHSLMRLIFSRKIEYSMIQLIDAIYDGNLKLGDMERSLSYIVENSEFPQKKIVINQNININNAKNK